MLPVIDNVKSIVAGRADRNVRDLTESHPWVETLVSVQFPVEKQTQERIRFLIFNQMLVNLGKIAREISL